jgi:2-aminoethylphosphonate-pyruvate transaminase
MRRRFAVDAIAASSNKCIEGVPGLGFVIARRAALEQTACNATTLVLDLHDQWRNFEKTGQYRFTPPIHVIVSFHQALTRILRRGRAGRGGASANVENCRVLIEGMRALGFEPLLRDELQGRSSSRSACRRIQLSVSRRSTTR